MHRSTGRSRPCTSSEMCSSKHYGAAREGVRRRCLLCRGVGRARRPTKLTTVPPPRGAGAAS
eukprot:1110788-Prymnesium_polylepis.1